MNLKYILVILFSVVTIGFLFFFSDKIARHVIPSPSFDLDFSINLINHNGEKVSKHNFIGNPSLVFFGFTNCPDVCPTTLNDLSLVLDDLGEKRNYLKVYFITLDPKRDTVRVLSEYIPYFGDQFIGITGEEKEMLKLVKNWGVYRKINKSSLEDYLIDHTASVYLLDSKSKFAGTIAYQENSEVVLKKLKNLIANFEKTVKTGSTSAK